MSQFINLSFDYNLYSLLYFSGTNIRSLKDRLNNVIKINENIPKQTHIKMEFKFTNF